MSSAKRSIRKSLSLLPEQWEKLEQVAEKTNSIAKHGSNVGSPSWRTLIFDIATNEKVFVIRIGESANHE